MYAEFPQHHEMILEKTHDSGAEEWYCPTCGRRFLMQWPPEYKKVILESGDESAVHSGGKGAVSMQPSYHSPAEDTNWRDEPELQPWIEWMERVNFEQFWVSEL